MIRAFLILVPIGLLMSALAAMAQSTDSLVLREQILLQENKRYIQMAQCDNIISSTQADSLRRITNGSVEKPIQLGIDILFQIRDCIDHEYDEQMRNVNEPVMEEYYYTANRMLPTKLGMPEGYVSPEEREEARQKLAMWSNLPNPSPAISSGRNSRLGRNGGSGASHFSLAAWRRR